jgi:hypothetical protein
MILRQGCQTKLVLVAAHTYLKIHSRMPTMAVGVWRVLAFNSAFNDCSQVKLVPGFCTCFLSIQQASCNSSSCARATS